ncbi:hypothetical protein P7C70_g2599, partial [Phenoliferia sp. Uapishka_3]
MPTRTAHSTSRSKVPTKFRSRKRQRRETVPTHRIDRHPVSEDPDDEAHDDDDEESVTDTSEENGRAEVQNRDRRRVQASGSSSANARASSSTSVARTAGGGSRLARRSSLPRRQSPPIHSNPKSSKPSLRAHGKSSSLAPPQTSTSAARQRVLSPLPTNHSVPRVHGMADKRSRETSGAQKVLRSLPTVSPRGKRKRIAVAQQEEEPESEEMEEDTRLDVPVSEEDEEEDDEEEEEEEEGQMVSSRARVGSRLRSADASGSREAEQEDVSLEEDHEEEEEGTEEAESDVEMTDEDDRFHIQEAPPAVLRRLRRDELARLYALSSDTPLSSQAHLHKEPLITAILDARAFVPAQEDEAEQDSGVDSPRPFTSHEASPEVESRHKLPKGAKKRSDRRATRRHIPTPPPSDKGSSESESSSAEDDQAIVQKPGPKGRSQSLPSFATRPVRSSHPDSTMRNGPRTRRGAAASNRVVRLRSGKSIVTAAARPSPIAHRTRHGAPSHSPPAKSRPSRVAKSKAVARLVKGKGKAVDQDAVGDADEESEGEESGEDSSDADEESGGDEAATEDRVGRQLRSGKVVPLEEDEESEDYEAPGSDVSMDGQDEEEQGSDASEVEVEQDDEEEGEDQDDQDGQDFEGLPLISNHHFAVLLTLHFLTGDDDSNLTNATSKSLLRCRRDDLVKLCEERDLDGNGRKKDLVSALLRWRETQDHDDSSGHSTASAQSNATARAETKTQALKAIPPSDATSMGTPLLMRNDSRSSASLQTPAHSKADEHEEVNALDLESLQLQDKEIMPEKLTKLEKIGSGGFKDVYKGLFRKRTIAIADIRGHLTDMDIKELGLLRDLRHPNIVHFIGVSIPKEPSNVPVMIVTELCANGDLFDYIRGVQQVPTFRAIVDIMLGIAKGVDYLHTRTPAIIHRDIKSSNVLITKDGVAKINDFGLARVKTSTRSMIRSLVGTVNWQAPELWVPHPRYNEKVDVYSVGLVFWEILQWHQPVKRYPFEGMNEHAIYDSVGQKNIRPSTASIGRTWGGEILLLLNVMWQGDHSQRPSMAAVVAELEIIKSTLPPEEKKSRR